MTTRANILGKKLTSKEAARLLGVSEASVKRWADSGLLPTIKTAGLLYEALLEGRSEEAAAILVRLHLDGSGVAELADAVLCPAMRRIGDLWHQGVLSVAQEHLATRTALEALSALRASLHADEAHGNLAVCCATEEDFHELPVHLVALTLDAHGWEVVNLGTSTPFYALAETVERFTPRMVCVASTILEGFDRAAREYTELSEAARRFGAAIVLGGAGFAGEDVRRRFPADLYADNFEQLEKFAVTLAAQGR